MNNKEITRKEFLAIAGGVLVFLFGGLPSKIVKNLGTQKKSLVSTNTTSSTGNGAYGGGKNTSLTN